MPDFTSHHLLAWVVRPRLPAPLQAAATRCPAAYFWGAQGPDPLFYAPFPGSLLPAYGHLLHLVAPGATFAALCRLARQAPAGRQEAALAYLAGFCCHYAMDSTFHPYVYALQVASQSRTPPGMHPALHGLIECRLDERLFAWLTGRPVEAFSPAGLYRPRPDWLPAVSGLLQGLLAGEYGLALAAGPAAGAFWACYGFNCLAYGHSSRLLAPPLAALSQLRGMPGRYVSHLKGTGAAAWLPGGGMGRTQVLPLFDRAISHSRALADACLQAVQAGAALPEGLFLQLFDAGNPHPAPKARRLAGMLGARARAALGGALEEGRVNL